MNNRVSWYIYSCAWCIAASLADRCWTGCHQGGEVIPIQSEPKLPRMNTMYGIVDFEKEGEVEVVPCSWLRGDLCYFPPGPNARKLIMKGGSPDEKWPTHTVSVKGVFGNYADARRWLDASQYTSDLNSESEGGKVWKRYTVRCCETDDEACVAPPKKPNSIRQGRKCSHKEKASEHSGPLSQDTDCLDSEEDVSGIVMDLPKVPSSFPFSGRRDLGSPHEERGLETSGRSTVMNSVELSSLEAEADHGSTCGSSAKGGSSQSGHSTPQEQEFQRNVLRGLHLVQLILRQHGHILETIAASHHHGQYVDVQETLIQSPFHSIQELKDFDSKITKEKGRMLVKEFQQFGGKDVKAATARIMAYVMTENVGQAFSWEGRKGKEKFVDLNLCSLIVRSVTTSPQLKGTTDFDVEVMIKNWLRRAPEKVKQKRQKAAVSLADRLSSDSE